MKQDLAEHFLVPPGKMVRIYNPVDVEMIQRSAHATANPMALLGQIWWPLDDCAKKKALICW